MSISIRFINLSYDSPSVASASTLSLPIHGDYFTITGSTAITTITASWFSREVWLVIDSGATATIVDGNNILLNAGATFGGAANRAIRLKSDGTNWLEMSRVAL